MAAVHAILIYSTERNDSRYDYRLLLVRLEKLSWCVFREKWPEVVGPTAFETWAESKMSKKSYKGLLGSLDIDEVWRSQRNFVKHVVKPENHENQGFSTLAKSKFRATGRKR